METWYEASLSRWGKRVAPVQVEKSTDKTVTINGRRCNRLTSDWRCYFPTEKEAWDYLVQRATAKVEEAQRSLQYLRSELGKVESERKAAGC